MTPEGFDAACRALTAVTSVRQWGDSEVYKVGGKVFACLGPDGSCVFKATDVAYEVLLDSGRGTRAPYFAPPWASLADIADIADDEMAGWLKTAHGLSAAKLTKKRRVELGLP